MDSLRFAVLTSSDAGARGDREDESGQYLCQKAESLGTVSAYCVLPDEPVLLERQLWEWVSDGIHVVLSTGSTGLGPRDVMPEVTRRVIDREIPGIAEALRAESLHHTPFGMISRGLSGSAGTTLIINLPGSPKAVQELWPLLEPIIPHVVQLLHGQTRHENS